MRRILGAAVLEREVERVVTKAANALIAETGMRRVERADPLAGEGGGLAERGRARLFNDLKDFWPDCRDDLTYEIRAGMEFMERYRIWHAASVDRFRDEMNDAMADDLRADRHRALRDEPDEPFAAEGPMPSKVGGVRVGRNNNGALTIPANISGYPAISIPAGLTSNGLPVGLQAYARRHEEALLLDLALAVERTRPWPLVAPGAPI